jgi:hypothetical protein
MSVDTLIVWIVRHQFGPERAVVSRHKTKKTLMLGDGQNGPHRLQDFAAGEISQGVCHGRNQILHPKHVADVTLTKDRDTIGLMFVCHFP